MAGKSRREIPGTGIRGSEFNTRYIAAYNTRRKTDPGFFTNPKWPVILADELTTQPSVTLDASSPDVASSVSRYSWPTIDQVSKFLVNAAVVIVLLLLGAIGVFVAANWNAVKGTFRIGHAIYKKFFGG